MKKRLAQPSMSTREGWSPQDGFERTAFTFVANVITAIGFALLLIAVSELAGGIVDWRHGVFWGFAAFTVFTLAPGLGLPPELPAMPAASSDRARSGGWRRLSLPPELSRSSSMADRFSPWSRRWP